MKTSSRYVGRVKRLAAIAAATVLAVVTLGAQAGVFQEKYEGELFGVRRESQLPGFLGGVVYANGTLYVAQAESGDLMAYDDDTSAGRTVTLLDADGLIPNQLALVDVDVVSGATTTDDYLLPGVLGLVAEVHAREPGQIIAGDVIRTREGSHASEVHYPQPHDLHAYVQWWNTEHHGGPGMFFPSRHLAAVGAVDTSRHFLMDYDYTLRFLAVTGMTTPRFPAAVIRHHDGCKSVKDGDEFVWECVQIVRPYQRQFPDIDQRATREGAGVLFGFGFRRWLFAQGGGWRFMNEGLRIHPFWAVYWLIPGWFLRKWARLRFRS